MKDSDKAREIFESMKQGLGKFYKAAKSEAENGQNELVREIDQIYKLKEESKRYIQSRIHAQGGMKTIIRSTDRLTHRQIAIAKIKSSDYSAKDLKTFLNEARILARLSHPNIVPLHDIGVDSNEQPYFTMKLLSGESLGCIIDKLALNDESYKKKYTLPRLLDIFLKVCDAVSFAHSRNIVHRDLKPDNIQVSDYGEVLLCDWGLAKDINLPNQSTEEIKISEILDRQTLNGTLKGTPGYMAPEQVENSFGEISEQTDIYALGCILYTLLTYKKPIDCDSIDTLVEQTVQGVFVPPSVRIDGKVPVAMDAVTMKAMSTNPEDRYSDADDIADEVKAYLDGFATDAQNASFSTQAYLLFNRHKNISLALMASIILISVTITYSVFKIKDSEVAALSAMKSAQALKLEKDELGKLLAPEYLDKAQESMKQYAFSLALKQVSLATDLDETLHQAWDLKGLLLIGKHQFQDAAKSLEKGSRSKFTPRLAKIAYSHKNIDIENAHIIISELKKNGGSTVVPFFMKVLYNKLTLEEKTQVLEKVFKSFHNYSGAPQLLITPNLESLIITASRNWKVKNLDYLYGLNLKEISLQRAQLKDLKALHGMKLKKVNLSRSTIADLSPLELMPIESLDISRSRVVDLNSIKKMPLKSINIAKTKIKILTPLLEIDSLETVTISNSFQDRQGIIELLKKKGIKIIKVDL
ncbi:MAG: protein kinase [Lentisphaeraceae bacterium]|nr:protein kinase [Lentisphaeraceae bacterium]